MTQRYRLRIARPAASVLAGDLPDKVATAANGFIIGPLLDDPHRVGTPLNPPMETVWGARRGAYRIVYRVHDAQRIVDVTAIRHRPDAYRI